MGLTTLQGFGRAGAAAGQRILIHAGSGGVGTFAVQYAKSSRPSRHLDHEFEERGFRQIARRRQSHRLRPRELPEQGGDYDIVYDTLGGAFTVDAFSIVKRGGTVISLSGPPDRDFARREGAGWLVGVAVWLMGRKVYAASASAGADHCWYFTEANGDQLRDIAALVERGAIKPVIDREFAFEQLPDALRYLEAGRARRKVVLKVPYQ